MACSNPFDALRLATESLPNEVFLQASQNDVWTGLIPREEYPMGTGLVQSVFTIGRSEPTTDEPEFTPITVTTGPTWTGSCGNSFEDVPVGFTEDTYSPEQFAWRGPTICQDDLIYTHKAETFWQKYIPAMSKNTLRTIGNRLAAIYDHYVPKAVANTDFAFVDGGTGHPPTSPDLELDESTCELSQEMLDATAVLLNEESAFAPNTNGWVNMGEDGPIYTLQIGQEASQRIQLNNAELRADYRNAYMGAGESNPLLKRLGATRVIRNFRHLINPYPPRYNYEGGQYVRVPTWIMPNATKGKKAEINPNWRSADFEGARVLTPWVFHSQIVKPVNSVAGMNWPPKSYMGEWQLIVGGKEIQATGECFDPLKKLAAHFAEYKHAPKPIFPEYGRLIIFRRCNDDGFACISCS